MDLAPYIAALHEHGFCIIENVLTPDETAHARARLWAAARENERLGASLHLSIDRNASSVRVFDLIERDALFREMIQHPTGIALVKALLGGNFLISNFTANIALPGSQSMKAHSDQGIVVPEPWLAPWSMNIIWCLNDVHAANGATLYLPGSHHITRRNELPADFEAEMKPFEAPAGSIIAMDGRLWHTSGANVTADEERAMMFAYYSAGFIRPQVNWNAALSPETMRGLSPQLARWLGVEQTANVALGARLVFTPDQRG